MSRTAGRTIRAYLSAARARYSNFERVPSRARLPKMNMFEYGMWEDAVREAGDSFNRYKDSEVRTALHGYTSKNVPPEFVAHFFSHNMGENYSPIQGHQEAIDAYVRLRNDNVDADYILALIAAGVPPEDIARFFEDAVGIDYALTLHAA